MARGRRRSTDRRLRACPVSLWPSAGAVRAVAMLVRVAAKSPGAPARSVAGDPLSGALVGGAVAGTVADRVSCDRPSVRGGLAQHAVDVVLGLGVRRDAAELRRRRRGRRCTRPGRASRRRRSGRAAGAGTSRHPAATARDRAGWSRRGAAAVPGISWVRPTAPAPLRALGSNPDSWDTRPFRSAGSIPLLAAAASISAPKAVLAPAPGGRGARRSLGGGEGAGERGRRRPRARAPGRSAARPSSAAARGGCRSWRRS